MRGEWKLEVDYESDDAVILTDGVSDIFVCHENGILESVTTREVQEYRRQGVVWGAGCIDYMCQDKYITEELHSLVGDPQNLLPHEVGLVKLKYGLTQQQLRIPVKFINERGIKHDF